MPTASTDVRGFAQVYDHHNPGGSAGPPLLLVHGWPETRRIWDRVVQPLADAGFEVIVPDLRGFGDSDVGPEGDPFGDVPSHSRDMHALVARPPRAQHVRRRRRGSRRTGDPGPVAALQGLRRAHGPVQLASAVPARFDGGHEDPTARRGGGLLHPPGTRSGWAARRSADARSAPALHRHVLHITILGHPARSRRRRSTT